MADTATWILTRSDEAQIRLTYLGNLEAVDVRIHRKTAESEGLEAYAPTDAGLVVPRALLGEFLGALSAIRDELEA